MGDYGTGDSMFRVCRRESFEVCLVGPNPCLKGCFRRYVSGMFQVMYHGMYRRMFHGFPICLLTVTPVLIFVKTHV